MEIYLDNSATTKPSPAVVQTLQEALTTHWYNPSAIYSPAMNEEKHVNAVRQTCLKAVNAAGERVLFTGSGTEADNLAILGHMRKIKKPGRVLILGVEHPAVLSCSEELRRMGHTVEELPTDRRGVLDLEALKQKLDADIRLICVMQVNNESGAIQPLSEVAALRNQLAPQAAIHVDGVQGFLRVPLDFHRLGIQSYAFSGHKIHACKGIGALIVRKDHRLAPINFGGGQEEGLRSGTLNTPGIFALGTAVETYPQDGPARMALLREHLWSGLKEAIPAAVLNGPEADSGFAAPHILNVSLPPVRSATMMNALEGDGIYVSAGSACASHKQKISATLSSMGVPHDLADCALRFSLCPDNTAEEIDTVVAKIAALYAVLSRFTRR